MVYLSEQKSSTRYGLIVFLILTLFICAIFFYVRNNQGVALANNVQHLTELDEDYSLIDSCIVLLYHADNNSRLYAVTGQNSYLEKFGNNVNAVSKILNQINVSSSGDGTIKAKNWSGLIAQKKTRTHFYLKLRKLTDSLINRSVGVDQLGKQVNNELGQELLYKKFKAMVTIDTIKILPAAKKKKKLFGRLGDAIKGEDGKFQVDPTRAVVRKEISLDTSFQGKKFNELQLSYLKNYFRNLYAANHMLNKNELAILQLNDQMITELVSLLQRYKNREIAFARQNKAELKGNIDKAFRSIDIIFMVSIALLIILVVAILYNLWKIFKNENALVNYSKKAAQYATSKSRFLANMSHEIRTPLNSVIGFSEQLSKSKLNAQQIEQVSAIRSSSVMLLDVVNDILDFSKYEIGKVNFDKMQFVPFDAITEVYNSIKIQATNKGLILKKELSFKRDVCFSGDSLRLKQVVMNLLSNAIKFTDQGTVTLKADVLSSNKKQDILNIQIIDTGIGIAKEDIDMIFDEFTQVYYSATKVKQKGTGLGLAICKKIVEFQGGLISVTSELGKGSIFSFQIPYDSCAASSGSEDDCNFKIETSQLAGKRILIADDNKMNVLLAQTVIKNYNMIADAAYDGKEALELFKINDYDLLLTDIQMPEMGGVELTKEIRGYHDATKAKIPILGVTANVLEEDRYSYLDSGIDDLVLKPFSEKDLISKIAIYLK